MSICLIIPVWDFLVNCSYNFSHKMSARPSHWISKIYLFFVDLIFVVVELKKIAYIF